MWNEIKRDQSSGDRYRKVIEREVGSTLDRKFISFITRIYKPSHYKEITEERVGNGCGFEIVPARYTGGLHPVLTPTL